MREILFRGKRTDTGEWVEGDLFHNLIFDGVSEKETRIGDVYFYGEEIHGTALCEVIPETVGQYTGLTDKNGKRIFEGDIIRNDADCIYSGEYKNPVVFDEGGFYGDSCCPFWASEFKYCEVIGNIHDNPELLEGDK